MNENQINIKTLFEPLIKAAGESYREELLQIIEKEQSGVLAWGVRSGYLLWTRQNPGATPTKNQVAVWMKKGKQI